jgi:ATP-dependent protease ClpP protease subunit
MIKKLLFVAALVCSATAQAGTITLTPDNTVTIRGPIDETSVNRAQHRLYELAKKRGTANYPLYLVLDTPGGSVTDGEDFIQYAKMIRNLHTVTIFAASMGSAIVQGLPGYRLMPEHGVQMFHRATVGLQGQIEDGELESRLQFYKSMVRKMEKRNADRMSMPLAQYKAKVKDELWMDSAQSREQKAADAIVDLQCSNELVEQNEVLTIQVFLFSIKLQFSACPLFRVPSPVRETENLKQYSQNYQALKTKLSKGVL